MELDDDWKGLVSRSDKGRIRFFINSRDNYSLHRGTGEDGVSYCSGRGHFSFPNCRLPCTIDYLYLQGLLDSIQGICLDRFLQPAYAE